MSKKAVRSFDSVRRLLRKRNFAVLSTADQQGRPQSVGVVYGVSPHSADLYVMTRRHLKKARNIIANPNVSMVVPLTRRLLWFLPPPCIQFQAKAEVLDGRDPIGVHTFGPFSWVVASLRCTRIWSGEAITGPASSASRLNRWSRPTGHSIWELSRRMEVGAEQVAVPDDYRQRVGGQAAGTAGDLTRTTEA